MELLNRILLFIHIIAGGLSLLAGLIAMSTAKGKKTHRLSGKIFFISMLIVSFSALLLALFKGNSFLLMIGIFSLHLNYSGFRSVKNKALKASPADWSITVAALLNACFMVMAAQIVLLFFGLLSLLLLFQDIRLFILILRSKEIPHLQWLSRHIGMMTGAYISTCTAFLVVNVRSFEPGWLAWVLPSLLGGPLIAYWTIRYTRKKPKAAIAVKMLVFSGGILLAGSSEAQPYTKAQTRHRFAQLNIGTDFSYYPSWNTRMSSLNNSGESTVSKLAPKAESRLIIGGTHFWGHADFFIAIPVSGFGRSGFSSSVETGARYLPWRIESGKLRPYIGASWMPVLYRQGKGVLELQYRFPLSAGFIFCKGNHLLGLNAAYIPANHINYYINVNSIAATLLPKASIGLSYRFMIETTLSAEKDWLSGKSRLLADTLGKLGKLDGLTLASGPSSAFYLRGSSHNKNFPYLKQHRAAGIFPEFGLGYYLHRADLQFNLAYRNIKSQLAAFGREQFASRKAVSFEVYKFISDYHGFAAFIGASLSYERLRLKDKAPGGTESSYTDAMLKPGIIMGWDIRPDRLQKFYLRTNIRWAPDLTLRTTDGKSFSFDQVEVNFIQLVLFPGRFF